MGQIKSSLQTITVPPSLSFFCRRTRCVCCPMFTLYCFSIITFCKHQHNVALLYVSFNTVQWSILVGSCFVVQVPNSANNTTIFFSIDAGCKTFCASVNKPWKSKCTWPICRDCPICSGKCLINICREQRHIKQRRSPWPLVAHAHADTATTTLTTRAPITTTTRGWCRV